MKRIIVLIAACALTLVVSWLVFSQITNSVVEEAPSTLYVYYNDQFPPLLSILDSATIMIRVTTEPLSRDTEPYSKWIECKNLHTDGNVSTEHLSWVRIPTR